MSVLAPFRLYDPDDHLRAVDVTILEPDNLPGAKPTAIAEGEHHSIPEAAGHRKQPLRLVGAHGERQLLRLFEVVDLGRQFVPPQRDAEQELDSGHDAVAIADAETALDQVELKATDVVGSRRIGRALQERCKQPAAVDVAALRMVTKLTTGDGYNPTYDQARNNEAAASIYWGLVHARMWVYWNLSYREWMK